MWRALLTQDYDFGFGGEITAQMREPCDFNSWLFLGLGLLELSVTPPAAAPYCGVLPDGAHDTQGHRKQGVC
jgi:hypothetical protein